MTRGPLNVLIVDDDDVDREGFVRGFDATTIDAQLTLAGTSGEALEILRGSSRAPPLPRPYVILLDLNMPRVDGFGFLDELRADPAIADAIVFVCTTSRSERDRRRAFGYNVAGYVSKTTIGTDWHRVAALIRDYWMLTELPV